MRWPWELVPWGRGRGADASDSAAGMPTARRPAPRILRPPGAFRPAPAATPAAWTRLPPLQRSVADTHRRRAAGRLPLLADHAPEPELPRPAGTPGRSGRSGRRRRRAGLVGRRPDPVRGCGRARASPTGRQPVRTRRAAADRHPPARPPGHAAPRVMRPVATRDRHDRPSRHDRDRHDRDRHDRDRHEGDAHRRSGRQPRPSAASAEVPEVPDQPPLVVARLAESGQPTRASQPDPGDSGSEDRAGQTADPGQQSPPPPHRPRDAGRPGSRRVPQRRPRSCLDRSGAAVSTNPPASGSARGGATGRVGDGAPAPTPQADVADSDRGRAARAGGDGGPARAVDHASPPPTASSWWPGRRSAPADQQPHRSTGRRGTAANVPEQTSAEPTGGLAVTGAGQRTTTRGIVPDRCPEPRRHGTAGRRHRSADGGRQPEPVPGVAARRSSASSRNPTSAGGSPPDARRGRWVPRRPGLDELGYPPLIARSGATQRPSMPPPDRARPARPSAPHRAAGPDPRPPAADEAAAQWLQRGDLGPPGLPSRSLGSAATSPSRWIGHAASQDPRSWWPDGWRRTRPASCPRRTCTCNGPSTTTPRRPAPRPPGPAQPDRRHVAPAAPPATRAATAADRVDARGTATPLRGRRRPERESPGRRRRPEPTTSAAPAAPSRRLGRGDAHSSRLGRLVSGGDRDRPHGPRQRRLVLAARTERPRHRASGASRATVQRTAAATSPAAVGATACPRSGEPSAPMVSPPPAAADRPR